jgi:hypothetical protein
MTYEQFERFFIALDLYYKRSEELGKAIESFNDSHTVISFCPELPNSIFTFLKEEFNDNYDWIDWWYWERKHNPEVLKAYDADKNEIILDTLEDLYTFLKGNL